MAHEHIVKNYHIDNAAVIQFLFLMRLLLKLDDEQLLVFELAELCAFAQYHKCALTVTPLNHV